MSRIDYRVKLVSAILLALCISACSTTIVGPPPKTAGGPQDFMWTQLQLAAGVDYNVNRLGVSSIHTLTSSDGAHIRDNTDTTGFLIRSSSDAVMLDSIGKNSIFNLPTGFAFASVPILTTQLLAIHAVMTSGPTTFVATDSGVYRSTDLTSWTRVLSGTTTVLAQDSQKTIYTAIGDSVFFSKNAGATWLSYRASQYGGRVSALGCRNDGRLYIGFADGGGVEYTIPGYYPQEFQTLPVQFKTIVAIAVQVIGPLTLVIVADSGGSVTVVHDSLVVSTSVSVPGVNCLLFNDTGGSYAGSHNLGILTEQPFQPNWNSVPNTKQFDVTGLTVDPSGTIFAVTSGGPVLRDFNGNFGGITYSHPRAKCVASSATGNLLIGTDSGLIVLTTAGVQLKLTGPSGTAMTQSAGALTLLDRAGLQSTSIMASWFGGNLVGPGLPAGIPITARIQDHVDSLRIPDTATNTSVTYGESYIIRYAPETSANSVVSGFPLYWVVYYSRGVGPVLIQEYYLGSDQKYSVQQQATIIPKR